MKTKYIVDGKTLEAATLGEAVADYIESENANGLKPLRTIEAKSLDGSGLRGRYAFGVENGCYKVALA